MGLIHDHMKKLTKVTEIIISEWKAAATKTVRDTRDDTSLDPFVRNLQ